MEDWIKALAAMNAIYNLFNSEAATLEQDFDSVTQEHVIRLEYRGKACNCSSTLPKRADESKDMNLLRELLAVI